MKSSVVESSNDNRFSQLKQIFQVNPSFPQGTFNNLEPNIKFTITATAYSHNLASMPADFNASTRGHLQNLLEFLFLLWLCCCVAYLSSCHRTASDANYKMICALFRGKSTSYWEKSTRA